MLEAWGKEHVSILVGHMADVHPQTSESLIQVTEGKRQQSPFQHQSYSTFQAKKTLIKLHSGTPNMS